MNKRISLTFLVLVLIQAFHSIEEYVGELWNVFPPAKALTGLISENLRTGFLVINIGLFVLGLLCWAFLVRINHKYAAFAIWFWIVLELINGVGHSIWSVIQGGYTPGLLTAPFLFVVAVYLLKTLYSNKSHLL